MEQVLNRIQKGLKITAVAFAVIAIVMMIFEASRASLLLLSYAAILAAGNYLLSIKEVRNGFMED